MARKKITLKEIYLDFTEEDVDDPIARVTADAVSSAGTLTYQVPFTVDVDGTDTTYYMYLYTTGT
jgi:hypothetical protein